MLAGASSPGRSKGRGHKECSPWSSRFRVGRADNKPTLKIFTITKSPEPMEKAETHSKGEKDDNKNETTCTQNRIL